MVGDFRVGLVTLSHPKPLDWSKADLRSYLVTAAHLATAIYSRQQQEKVSQQAQELAAFSERQRLARDLHDSVNQLIFSMTLLAQSVAPAMKRSAPEGEERVARLLELAQRTRAEMRALLSELRPASNTPAMSDRYSLQREGLVQTLNQHFARLPGSLSLKLEAQDYQPQAEPIEEALLRIAQEAVGNVIKHARANEVRLRLSADKKACYLSVKDDGIGFDTKAVGVAGNLGLKTMQERALALGGVVKLVSSQGKGTELNVRIPLRGKMRKEA
jgi:signal transduction histidine kinase